MDRHLIVLDLDGTLLKDDKTISEKTKQTLFKAKEAGHEVMIATGRPFRASELYYNELMLKTPIVNFNGALVHHPKSRSFKTVHSPMDIGVVHDVVDSVDKYQYKNLIAEVMDSVYIHTEDQSMMDIFKMGDPNVTIGNLRGSLNEDPTSLLIHAEEDKVSGIRKHLEDVHAELIDHRRWGAPFHIIEIVRKGLNKAVGISLVAKELDIPRKRIIAFGDEDNDLEMIEYAGVGVAMSNGIDELKSIANEVTLSNNEDGIAKVLIERLKLN
nr:Cof-type HAD-IIB family hydrolase [Lysinibacillus timonensis]